VNAQQGFQRKPRPTGPGHRRVRRDQRQQLCPWHGLFHLGQKYTLARLPAGQVDVQRVLFHVLGSDRPGYFYFQARRRF
jgi:hypothetical protein